MPEPGKSVLLEMLGNNQGDSGRRESHARSNSHSLIPSMQFDEFEPRRENCANQNRARELYESPTAQIAVAVVIFLNFLMSAVQAQMVVPGDDPGPGFVGLEWAFAVIFTIELIWNMYGSWWSLFWSSGWNWFDFIIVIISLLALLVDDLPGLAVLRLFRAFRVFRLFKRIESLKLIIDGVLNSLPGVGNAFLVTAILMGIWSIMGVEFFGHIESCEEEFGSFAKAMLTMYQIMTLDFADIMRKVVYDVNMPMAAVFFVSYTFMAGIVMANVVVAILLEKYLACTTQAAMDKYVQSAEELKDGLEADVKKYEAIMQTAKVKSSSILTKEFNTLLRQKRRDLQEAENSYVEDMARQQFGSTTVATVAKEGGSAALPTVKDVEEKGGEVKGVDSDEGASDVAQLTAFAEAIRSFKQKYPSCESWRALEEHVSKAATSVANSVASQGKDGPKVVLLKPLALGTDKKRHRVVPDQAE